MSGSPAGLVFFGTFIQLFRPRGNISSGGRTRLCSRPLQGQNLCRGGNFKKAMLMKLIP
jgi:hypothetical protein